MFNTDLDTKENCPERHGRRPLVLQDVQADGARHARDVGVPDLGDEANLRHEVAILSRVMWCHDVNHLGRGEGVGVRNLDF